MMIAYYKKTNTAVMICIRLLKKKTGCAKIIFSFLHDHC